MDIKYNDLLPIFTDVDTRINSLTTVIDSRGTWSILQSVGATLIAANGFDKSITTYLRSSVGGPLNGYIEITFPNEYLIGKYKLELGVYNVQYGNMASWDIEALVNESWVTVHSGTNDNVRATKEYEFTPVNTNKIRIRCTGKHGNNSWGFDDFYIYEAELLPFNKTLILHNDEYKNYKEVVQGVIISDLLPFAFTSNSMNGVKISASTELASYPPYLAFDKSNGTQWITSTSSAIASPQYITIEFNEPKKVTGLIINQLSSRISEFSLKYSDNGSDFTTAFSGNINTYVKGEDVEFQIINQEKHRYWRFSIDLNSSGNPHGIASLTLLGEVENKKYKWNTVSSTLPTINQFVDSGMDSLTPLLDRKVMQLEPQVITQDSIPVGDGKVYRKKVNLNKYFDIRTITTETRDS